MSELTEKNLKSKSVNKIKKKEKYQKSNILNKHQIKYPLSPILKPKTIKIKNERIIEYNSKSYRTLNILNEGKINKNKQKLFLNTKTNFYKGYTNKNSKDFGFSKIESSDKKHKTIKGELKIKTFKLNNNYLNNKKKFSPNKSNNYFFSNSNKKNKINNNLSIENNKKDFTLNLSEKKENIFNDINSLQNEDQKKSDTIQIKINNKDKKIFGKFKADINDKKLFEYSSNKMESRKKNFFEDIKNKTVEPRNDGYIKKINSNNDYKKSKNYKKKIKLRKFKINKLINNKNRISFSPKINRDLLNIRQNLIFNQSLDNKVNFISLKNQSLNENINDIKNLTIKTINKNYYKKLNIKYIYTKKNNKNKQFDSKINIKQKNNDNDEIKLKEDSKAQIGMPNKVLRNIKNSSRNSSTIDKENKYDIKGDLIEYKIFHNNIKNKNNNNPRKQIKYLNSARSQSDIDSDYIIKKLEKDSNSISKNQESSTKELKPNEFEEKKILRIDSICKRGFAGPGIKKINQDNYFIFNNLINNKDYIFMGICDGHGVHGHDISNYLVINLPQNLNEKLISEKINDLSGINIEKFSKIISSTFLETNKNLVANESIDSLFSGSTCSSIIYTPRRLISINVGDSRSIIGKFDGKIWRAKNLSRDHKPDEPDEYDRIIKSGGKVQSYKDENGEPVGPERVWLKNDDVPGLAMSRSFGDIIAHSVGVIAEPEIFDYSFVHEDKFVIIASDGIFEFISSDECVSMVKNFYLKDDIEGAMYYLYKESSKKWIMEEEVIDDISLILIFLN